MKQYNVFEQKNQYRNTLIIYTYNIYISFIQIKLKERMNRSLLIIIVEIPQI